MGSSRKSYQQLDAEIQALINRRNALVDESAELFCRALLTKEVKNKIAELPPDIIKAAGKKVAASIDKVITSVSKRADDKWASRPDSADSMTKTDITSHPADVSSPAVKPANDTRSSGASLTGTGTANQHHG